MTLLAVGVLLAGCTMSDAQNPESSDSPSPSASSSAAEPVDLSLAVYGSAGEIAAYRDLARAYQRDYPQVTLTVTDSADAASANARLQDQLADGTAPDVFLVDHAYLPQLVEEKQIQPVNTLLEDRQVNFGDGFQRDSLEAFSASAALQCMPNDVSPTVVYYNKDLVDLTATVEEGETPPNAEDGWTWEQFATAARQASQGPAKGVYLEPSLRSLAPFIWSASADLVDDVDEPTSLALSTSDSRAALEQVLALVRDPQVTPTPAELAEQDALTRFEKGRLAMIMGTRALTPELRESVNFDVMPLPSLGRYRTIAEMNGFCVSADTRAVDAAADFVAYAVGREGATITTTAGYSVPSNLEVAISPAFAQPGKAPESAFVFTEGARRAEMTPFVREWPRLDEELGPTLERMFYAPVLDLEQMLADIDTTSQAVLAPEVPVEQP